ncbi:nucleotide exchange factor GrpE [Gordonia westfalica]|uniref:Nucleotide exchange factor GrpE n=1 Tax=Gordonia westfalica TaxID=158898 RepID=A0ABU2GWY9_9ACTN|nr:nucleotide exchange factor GrpE [Gordonia westfalica]MDS1115474.1 nucleotide exchange factor GrpE [Gordonia westfalica]
MTSDHAAAPSATALGQLQEQLTDLGRVVARQTATIERLAAAAGSRTATNGADAALLVDLFALYTDAVSCAASASEGDRAAFGLLASGLERIITGRGGAVVTPAAGADFDARTMEAVDVATTTDPTLDRTVLGVVRPGLLVADRSVRAAAVVVYRVAPSAS